MFSKLQHKVSENVTTLLKGGWGGGGGERSRSDLLKTVFHCPCSIFCHFYVSLQEFCKIKKKTHTHTRKTNLTWTFAVVAWYFLLGLHDMYFSKSPSLLPH